MKPAARIRILRGSVERTIDVAPGTVTIGRASTAIVRIAEEDVAPEHAVLHLPEAGEWSVIAAGGPLAVDGTAVARGGRATSDRPRRPRRQAGGGRSAPPAWPAPPPRWRWHPAPCRAAAHAAPRPAACPRRSGRWRRRPCRWTCRAHPAARPACRSSGNPSPPAAARPTDGRPTPGAARANGGRPGQPRATTGAHVHPAATPGTPGTGIGPVVTPRGRRGRSWADAGWTR